MKDDIRKNLIRMAIFLPMIYFLDILGMKGSLQELIMIGISILLLIISADCFLSGAKGLSFKAKIPLVVIGLTIVSVGTSIPEIACTLMASYKAKITGNFEYSDFAIGTIYGSVLVQITAIMGIVVIFKPMVVQKGTVKRDGIAMIGAVTLLSFFVLQNKILDTIEACVLVAIYIVFLSYLVKSRKRMLLEEGRAEIKVKMPYSTSIYLITSIISIAVVVLSSEFLVRYCLIFAEDIGVGGGVVGITISSIGTSLPELAIALTAVSRAHDLSIGTLIGSNVTDPLLSVGLAGIVNPLTIPDNAFLLFSAITVPATIIACVLGVIFMWTKWELERWEGAVLTVYYAVFLLILIIFVKGVV